MEILFIFLYIFIGEILYLFIWAVLGFSIFNSSHSLNNNLLRAEAYGLLFPQYITDRHAISYVEDYKKYNCTDLYLKKYKRLVANLMALRPDLSAEVHLETGMIWIDVHMISIPHANDADWKELNGRQSTAVRWLAPLVSRADS